ncbi:MAG TPA: hypothetical protein VNH18_29525 [Bryobacteraceae bacterium]|nr:hypothetical protein [Blastocatellia bacterium]HXJ43459.1 hypothetical protein [Bryobacteraceae bacterium]
MNIYAIGALVAIGFWGVAGVGHGVGFVWKNKGCIVKHGIHACKVQAAAKSALDKR